MTDATMITLPGTAMGPEGDDVAEHAEVRQDASHDERVVDRGDHPHVAAPALEMQRTASRSPAWGTTTIVTS